MCSAWLGSCLKAARVRTLIGHGHPLDLDGEIAFVVVSHRHSRVQRPLLVSREQDVRAVQPGLVGHLLVDLTPARRLQCVAADRDYSPVSTDHLTSFETFNDDLVIGSHRLCLSISCSLLSTAHLLIPRAPSWTSAPITVYTNLRLLVLLDPISSCVPFFFFLDYFFLIFSKFLC